jgi:GDP-L-fucose synthase
VKLDTNANIFVAGHQGLVGSAIVRLLKKTGFQNVIVRTRSELDLCHQQNVQVFFQEENIDYVFLAAAKVGGINANNSYPAEFIFQNLQIQNNVIHQSYLAGIKKLCFLGSSCIYPKYATQPIYEDALLSGKLEPTNEPYAVAKIAGITLCQAYNRQYGTNFISVMPTNVYGPHDNFHTENSHVLPALIRKFSEAQKNNAPSVMLWGSGTPKREFLFVDDLAEACVSLMNTYNESEIVNVGVGEDISISDLAMMIKEEIHYKGTIAWDKTKPDGTPRKLLNVDKIHSLGWKAKTSLRDGIRNTIAWYRTHSLEQ